MNDADIVREFFDDAENAEKLHGFVLPMSAPRAALDRLVNERVEARNKVVTHTEGLLALTAERDRWRAIACNVKDGTAAAEARVQQLKAALTRVAASGPCSSGCADFARAALADLEDTP